MARRKQQAATEAVRQPKLNITLRVTGRRPDGYHDLLSTFLRIPSGESLQIGRAHV